MLPFPVPSPVSSSQGRGVRRLVEDVGRGLYAGWLSRVHGVSRLREGVRYVGRRRVAWLLFATSVEVIHPPPRRCGPPLRYGVGLLFTTLPSGGSRWWWMCPACDRRVDVLYLPPDRDRLACRVCCGLRYRSQYTRGRVRRHKRRPATNVAWFSGWVWLQP